MHAFEKFCKSRVKITAVRDGNREPCTWDASRLGVRDPVQSFGVTLVLEGRSYSCDFHRGSGHVYPRDHHRGELRGKPTELTAADVISCLLLELNTTENVSSFEEFCDELGYDSDSRQAFAVWEKLEREAPKLRQFFGDQLEEFNLAATDY